ncbi:PD-(D/E)XK nuclease-like domain-containing protein [Hydrogenophaga sp. PBL-H3]|jgi:hypothetical protein|uniref:PD-(D/E)XK nuclease-like domain-containing protein n=1 Tax=Hydrogenophaga sp. PBL-H3 TaxID=434010 RepID=UPI00131FD1C3|nr:PD-(D/E)XK nuclease-like domain-containing protein [Hydrogenophaga sp. PBL-H3]QHE78547.1 hypothetical protein F9Z45_20570 [Hydrogenophaga sp. PBL-H3]QHE82972.1 hypothetical protein F9Z44_20570 [Hydrogenophaga sp. PBL-H3]
MDTFTDFADALSMAAVATQEEQATVGFSPGSFLYKDLPAHVYHAGRESLSCSLLKPLLISPAHFKTALVQQYTSSSAKDFGSLLHLLLLQPHLAGQEVAVYPGIGNGRDRAYKSFLEANVLKLVVDEPTFSEARALTAKVQETTFKGRKIGLFLEEALTEVSIYFTEPTTGLKLRIRPDIYHPDMTLDLKSTRHGTVAKFGRDAVDMDYDLQAFMYSMGRSLYEGSATPKPFVFLAAETSAPHSIHRLTASESFLTNGAKKFQECLSIYKACTLTDHWPDLSSEGEIELDHWHQYTPSRAWMQGATV